MPCGRGHHASVAGVVFPGFEAFLDGEPDRTERCGRSSVPAARLHPRYEDGQAGRLRSHIEGRVDQQDRRPKSRRLSCRRSGATMTEPAPRIDFADLPAPEEGILVTLFITVRSVARSRDFYSRVLGGTVVLDENPCIVRLSNSWILMNPGGPPTPDKPGISVVDYQPGDTTSIFLNLRVADIQGCYEAWKESAIARPACELPEDGMALAASWRGGSVGMSAGGHAYRQAQVLPGAARSSGETDMGTVHVAPAAAEERRSSRAFRHRPRRHLPRLCAARPHRHRPHAERAPAPGPADPHARARQLLPDRMASARPTFPCPRVK